MIIDAPVAQNAVEEEGGVEIAEKVPTEEEYGIALAKDNTELLEEINEGLAEVNEDGTYTTIYEKWFHLEPPEAIRSARIESEQRGRRRRRPLSVLREPTRTPR